jgi:hypothetical protein
MRSRRKTRPRVKPRVPGPACDAMTRGIRVANGLRAGCPAGTWRKARILRLDTPPILPSLCLKQLKINEH